MPPPMSEDNVLDSETLPPLALTCGDPNGIGLELSLMAWRVLHHEAAYSFFIIADPEHLAFHNRHLGTKGAALKVIDSPKQATTVFATALPVLPTHQKSVPLTPGRANPAVAGGTLESIERAVEFCLKGQAAAVVTNPIAKAVLYEAGFKHPGHTEYLGVLARRAGLEAAPVMMLMGAGLRVVPITIHIPLKAVPAQLNSALIITTSRVVARDLRVSFGIEKPRLAFAGLNPHAGEAGALGREEIEIITPALEVLRGEGIDVIGPLPADTMFHGPARKNYDVALGMYHDQVLIPLKTLAFESGVNITLGLPFVRTSPDHGTAYALAGTGRASPESLIQAIKVAAQMARQRRRHSSEAAMAAAP